MSRTTSSPSTIRSSRRSSPDGGWARALRGAALRPPGVLVALCLAALAGPAGCGRPAEQAGGEAGVQRARFDVGSPAPSFTLPDLQGNRVSLDSMKGRVLILDFWATWCPPCKEEVPHFVRLQSKYRDQGLEIVGLSLDGGGAKDVIPFAEEYDVNYTMLVADDETAKAYGGITMIPTTFVVDRNGIVVKRFIGYTPPGAFEETIRPLLAPAS